MSHRWDTASPGCGEHEWGALTRGWVGLGCRVLQQGQQDQEYLTVLLKPTRAQPPSLGCFGKREGTARLE